MLSGVLSGLLLLLATLLGLVAMVLVTPVRLGASLRTAPEWRARIELRLLGGLIPPIPVHDSAARRPKREPGAKRKMAAGRKAARPETASRPRRVIARGSRVIVSAPRLVVDLLRPIQVEHLRVDADVGLADPADTGQLYGLLAAVLQWFRSGGTVQVEVRPDFTGPCLAGQLDAAVRFVPAAFIPPGIRLAWRLFGPDR